MTAGSQTPMAVCPVQPAIAHSELCYVHQRNPGFCAGLFHCVLSVVDLYSDSGDAGIIRLAFHRNPLPKHQAGVSSVPAFRQPAHGTADCAAAAVEPKPSHGGQ